VNQRVLLLFAAALLVWGCKSKVEMPFASSATSAAPGGGPNYAADLQRQKTLATLRALGLAYLSCLTTAPPRDENDLKGFLEGPAKELRSARDQQPLVVCYGVDPSRLPDGASATLIAWEKTADNQGGRCVLYADGRSAYLSRSDFEAAKKAKPAGQ
jgi:hypothetical protein